MVGMQQFFAELTRPIVSFGQFIVSFLKDTIEFIKLIAKVPIVIKHVFSWLPPTISVALISLFAVVVLYKILGREG